MKKNLYLISILLFAIIPEILSQDVHFSMFYRTPILLNPANTGNFNGLWRINTTYRKQGDFTTNPYSSNVLTFDMPVYYFQRIGSIGISLMNDRTANRTLNTSFANLSTAHFVRISKFSYLHLGFSFAITCKSINYNNLTFPNQFDNSTGTFNLLLDNKENFDRYSSVYLDLAWGAMWSRITGNFDSQIGVAMFHYNQPKLRYFSESSKIKPKFQVHSYFRKKLNKTLFVKPKFLFTFTGKANELLIGGDFTAVTTSKTVKNLYAGTYLRTGLDRNTDALIFLAGLTYNNFKFTFSYDYTGQTNIYSDDLTFEISIFYIMPKLNPQNKSIQCEIL